MDHEAKKYYEVQVEVSDGKDDDGNADPSVDASVTIEIEVLNLIEGPAPDRGPSPSRRSRPPAMKVTVTPPDTTGSSPIEYYAGGV